MPCFEAPGRRRILERNSGCWARRDCSECPASFVLPRISPPRGGEVHARSPTSHPNTNSAVGFFPWMVRETISLKVVLNQSGVVLWTGPAQEAKNSGCNGARSLRYYCIFPLISSHSSFSTKLLRESSRKQTKLRESTAHLAINAKLMHGLFVLLVAFPRTQRAHKNLWGLMESKHPGVRPSKHTIHTVVPDS